MTKTKRISDIEKQLKNMEVISNKDAFKILDFLVKHQTELTSFTSLKDSLKLNPNSLSKHLKKLNEIGLVDNYYKKEEDRKHFSFYRITEKGRNTLNIQIGLPRIWELLDQFKEYCKSKGWITVEHEDWVKTGDGKYHVFFWVRMIHPSVFEKIVAHKKMAIRKGISHEVVDVAYTAFLFPNIGPNELNEFVTIVMQNPKLAEGTAIYDLSQAYLMSPVVAKLNETNSEVFREFEYFLQSRWKLKLMDMESFLEENIKVRLH